MTSPSEGTVCIFPLPKLPVVAAGDDLASLIVDAYRKASWEPKHHDVLVITSKVVSRAQGRFVDLQTVHPDKQAIEIANEIGKDPRLVALVLAESSLVARKAPGILITKHHLGLVSANAGIDQSNALPQHAEQGTGPWVLLLPQEPDRAARQIGQKLEQEFGVQIAVIISDSLGRPFRVGTVGSAIGVYGVPAISDQRGKADLFGRPLEHTITAFADQIAASADMVAGQAAEGRAVVVVRGMEYPWSPHAPCSELIRPTKGDLFL
jgi:coenzyme F420-0:L-glutamate ligase / coenzyme F420-1:gamma-L-glutamate ligase